jgi:hypothetical protein
MDRTPTYRPGHIFARTFTDDGGKIVCWYDPEGTSDTPYGSGPFVIDVGDWESEEDADDDEIEVDQDMTRTRYKTLDAAMTAYRQATAE